MRFAILYATLLRWLARANRCEHLNDLLKLETRKIRHDCKRSGYFLILFAVLSGCSQETTPGPEIHDTKYQALGDDGQPLENAEHPGSCVLDQFTGLMWQVKSESPGLNDWHNTYSWYNPQEPSGPELDYRGTANGGSCTGSNCDTWDYVKAINQTGLCGYHDWRMPSRDALASISDSRKMQSPPTINTKFFPYTQPDEYWSGNDYHFQWDSAWTWNYKYGHDRVDWKSSAKYVRLVRGTALQLERVKD